VKLAFASSPEQIESAGSIVEKVAKIMQRRR